MKTQIHLLKNLVLTTLALLAVLPMQAQNVGDAIYIYRNDGEFNAFYREEIDSMAYSYYDVDSVRYEEIVTQLIYTEDSIYHIPIAVIDSVSFVPPVNEYQPNVVKIDNLIPYVESVEGMKLCLSSDVPSNLLPKTGDVLIYESFENEMFPMGFAGEVKETKPSYVLCDSVSFEDIYKKYVCFGTYVAIGDEGTEEGKVRLVPRRRIEGKLSSSITINEHFGTEGSGLFGTTSIKMGFDLRIEFKFEVGKPAFFDLSVQPEIKSRVEAGIKGKFNLMDLFPHKPNLLCVPIPNTLFLLKLKGGPLVSFIIEASATVSAETSMGFKAGLKYSNEKWKTYKKKTSKGFSTPTITGYMSGTLFAGLQTEFGIFSYGDIISASIIKEVGGEMLIRLEENLLNTNKYDELKKATTDLNLKATVGAKAGLKLAKWYQITPRVDLLSLKIPLNSWPIVPEFSNLSWSPDKSGYKGTLKGNVSGNLLFPVTLGWALYDKKDNLYKTMYFPATYRKIEDWQQNGIEYALEENLPYGAHYKAYPLVKLFDAVMRADQYVEINADAFVETGAASDITCSEATLAGKAEGLEYGQDVDAGVAYTLNQNSDKWTNVSANRREDGSYTVKVSNLQSDQTYYYRAYAYVDGKYYYGETKSFKTEKELAVSTLAASGVTENSAVVSGQLENYKAERLTAYGIAYGTSSGNMQKMAAGNLSADGVFSISLTEL